MPLKGILIKDHGLSVSNPFWIPDNKERQSHSANQVDFAALKRQHDLSGATIAADQLELRAAIFFER